jgi:hypothetical protein
MNIIPNFHLFVNYYFSNLQRGQKNVLDNYGELEYNIYIEIEKSLNTLAVWWGIFIAIVWSCSVSDGRNVTNRKIK